MRQSSCCLTVSRARWVGTDAPQATRTAQADAVWVLPGSPYHNDTVVYSAIEAARRSGQPFLGTCGGFQYAVVEFARNVAGIVGADHAETATGADNLVVDRLACSLVCEKLFDFAKTFNQSWLRSPNPVVPVRRLWVVHRSSCGVEAIFPQSRDELARRRYVANRINTLACV